MTIREAKHAMMQAERDDMTSLVNPQFTRKQLAANADKLLFFAVQILKTHLEPDEARMICAIVQDCPDPVPIHFAYQQDGGLTVGWNRDEVALRKGDKSIKDAAERLAREHSQKELVAAGPAVMLLPKRKTASEKLEAILRIEQQRAFLESIYNNGFPTNAQIAEAGKEKQNEPKKPEEPKPDPTSPKFVLKRPKL